jgi:hypothetical protein
MVKTMKGKVYRMGSEPGVSYGLLDLTNKGGARQTIFALIQGTSNGGRQLLRNRRSNRHIVPLYGISDRRLLESSDPKGVDRKTAKLVATSSDAF